jgi:hypothetical protein
MSEDLISTARRVSAGGAVTKGMTSYFDIDGVTITLWASAWTGRETVHVDDRLVSDRRSFSRETWHEFSHGGRQYRLKVRVVSLLHGGLRCELYRDGALVDSDELAIEIWARDPETGRIDWKQEFRSLGYIVLAGAVVGFAVGLGVGLWKSFGG